MIRVPPTAESMATLPADLPEGLSLGTQVRVRAMKKRCMRSVPLSQAQLVAHMTPCLVWQARA